MRLTLTLVPWVLAFEGRGWLKNIPVEGRDGIELLLSRLIRLVATVEAVFLVFELVWRRGWRRMVETVKLALSLFGLEEEARDEGAWTPPSQAFCLRRNLHSSILHLESSSSAANQADDRAASARHDLALQPVPSSPTANQPLQAAEVSNIQASFHNLAQYLHDILLLPLPAQAEIFQHIPYICNFAAVEAMHLLTLQDQKRLGFLAIFSFTLMDKALNAARGQRDAAFETLNIRRDASDLFRAFSLAVYPLFLALPLQLRDLDLVQTLPAHCAFLTASDTVDTVLSASEALEDRPSSTVPPPSHQPYLCALKLIEALGQTKEFDSRAIHESRLRGCVELVEAEAEASKAEEKLCEAILEAVLRRKELKRMIKEARRKKQEREEEVEPPMDM